MFLPHLTAVKILAKLSSRRMISDASLATSVPVIPIAKPTSAFLRAGASLVPSPVTATTDYNSLRPVTSIYLSSGVDLARTLSLSLMCLNIALLAISSFSLPSLLAASFFTSPPQSSLNYLPSMHEYSTKASSAVRIPASIAMALAVSRLSPVTILMLIPAFLHNLADSTISSLSGS